MLASVARGGAEDIDRAVAAARSALQREEWALADPAQRGRVLVALADLMLSRLEALAELEARDTGHPISDARAVDVSRGPLAAFAGTERRSTRFTGRSRRATPTRSP